MNRQPALPLLRLCLACLLLVGAGAPVAAQDAPANVITPAPPPREGTVGPEQLRDFSLPGTRTAPVPAPAPAPETAAPAPRREQAPRPGADADRAPAPQPVPSPRLATASPARQQPSGPLPSPVSGPAPTVESGPPAPQVTVGLGAAKPPTADPTPLLPSAPPSVFPETEAAPTEPWSSRWAWLLAAGLLGLLLALLLWRRNQPRLAPAGPGFDLTGEESPPVQPAPVAEPAPAPPISPAPALPAGLVTTRLRSVPPAAPREELPAAPAGLVSTRLRPAPPAPPERLAGAVVSTRLRPWVDVDLTLSEVLITETEALLRFRLQLLNSGMATARDIVIEALALNASERQAAEIGTFFERPNGAEVGVAELPRLQSAELGHDVRMPRAAIRPFEVQGRRLFVPILAFNIGYRWAHGEGRTSAAFLIGHDQPDSDRLAPLRLEEGRRRLSGLGVRRLAEQIRR